jgi:glycosyltransferase involved in cell wall biosynthesis
MSERPILSICVPAYNGNSFLSGLIEAVRAQSFGNWELILVNNASTDGTAELLRSIELEINDPRIKVFTNATTVPMAENWNIAVNYSSGEFLKLICADDIPTPDCFERQVKVLRDNPSASMASGSRIIMNGVGKRLFIRNGIGKTGLYNGRKTIRGCIMAGTNIIGDPVNVMWRRSAMEKVGLFDPTVVYCTDIEYWLRLLSVGDLYYDTEPTGYYRIHGNAVATGLGDVTVQDFVHTAKLQVKRGSVALSAMDLRVIAWKSHLQSRLRQYLYRLLG